MIREWTPLGEVLARAGSPERLIRRCQETFAIARFAYVKYVNLEGQPDRSDRTIAWGWWSLRSIRVTADYIDFGRGLKAFRIFGVEFLKPHADKLFPERSEQPPEPPAADAPSETRRVPGQHALSSDDAKAEAAKLIALVVDYQKQHRCTQKKACEALYEGRHNSAEAMEKAIARAHKVLKDK